MYNTKVIEDSETPHIANQFVLLYLQILIGPHRFSS